MTRGPERVRGCDTPSNCEVTAPPPEAAFHEQFPPPLDRVCRLFRARETPNLGAVSFFVDT